MNRYHAASRGHSLSLPPTSPRRPHPKAGIRMCTGTRENTCLCPSTTPYARMQRARLTQKSQICGRCRKDPAPLAVLTTSGSRLGVPSNRLTSFPFQGGSGTISAAAALPGRCVAVEAPPRCATSKCPSGVDDGVARWVFCTSSQAGTHRFACRALTPVSWRQSIPQRRGSIGS